jgi:hypothetical protein
MMSLFTGGAIHTHTTILVRVALYGALHKILKGAYNSGTPKVACSLQPLITRADITKEQPLKVTGSAVWT